MTSYYAQRLAGDRLFGAWAASGTAHRGAAGGGRGKASLSPLQPSPIPGHQTEP